MLGADGITADMTANNDSACTWLRDNMKVDWSKKGAQAYYNSIFDLYAQWGVDFVKIDDLSRPYHTAEIDMIRHAIDQCGRPIVLVATDGGDGYDSDHADWVNPVLVRENGEEVSLTTITWNSNPVNGWNTPKVNRNNDGNRLKVAGTEYDNGFGVNAPSACFRFAGRS